MKSADYARSQYKPVQYNIPSETLTNFEYILNFGFTLLTNSEVIHEHFRITEFAKIHSN